MTTSKIILCTPFQAYFFPTKQFPCDIFQLIKTGPSMKDKYKFFGSFSPATTCMLYAEIFSVKYTHATIPCT